MLLLKYSKATPFLFHVQLGQSLNPAAWEGTADWQELFCSHLLLGCVGLTKFLWQQLSGSRTSACGWGRVGRRKACKGKLKRQVPQLLKAGSDIGIQPGRSQCRIGISWCGQLDKFGCFWVYWGNRLLVQCIFLFIHYLSAPHHHSV